MHGKISALLFLIILISSCKNPSSVFEPDIQDTVEYRESNWTKMREYKCPDESEADHKISPGDRVSDIVRASPHGSKFFFTPGVYDSESIQPKNGMMFYGHMESEKDSVIFNGSNQVRFAFHGKADDVLICGLVIENYIPGVQMGAIKAGDHVPENNTNGWIVTNTVIRHNDGAAIRTGHNMTISGNLISHNSQIGIAGSGDNLVIEDNEISFHNTNQKHDYNWEAGGTKFVMTNNLIVRNNYVHDNYGHGLWTDIQNQNTLYEGNITVRNAGNGIFHEISFLAVIRDNFSGNNGFGRGDSPGPYGAEIMVSSSSDVDVYNNTVNINRNGIVAIQQLRIDERSDYYYRLDNIKIKHNTYVENDGSFWAITGVYEDISDKEVFRRNILFNNNVYHLSTIKNGFRWHNKSINWFSWRKAGHDADGVLN